MNILQILNNGKYLMLIKFYVVFKHFRIFLASFFVQSLYVLFEFGFRLQVTVVFLVLRVINYLKILRLSF
jgi:hypothetical protein